MHRQYIGKNDVPHQAREILETVGQWGFIAGGFARNLLADSPPPNDIDIFCYNNRESYASIIRNLRLRGYESGQGGYNSYPLKHPNRPLKVQVIKPHADDHIQMYGPIDTVLRAFDFTVNCAAIFDDGTPSHYNVLVHPDFYFDNRNKQLNLNNINNPVAMIARIIKYAKYGYNYSMVDVARIMSEYHQRADEPSIQAIEERLRDNTLTDFYPLVR